MRNAFSEELYSCATRNEKVHIVVADISPAGSMAQFQEQYPERFINVGVAEQVMIGFAAGLALRGLQPFAYTIATFSVYRPFEMIRNDLCYQNLPVTVVGMGAGVTYSTLGGTHHTMEDVALASAVPNMQIIAPCDPAEVRAATAYCSEQRIGPVYLRIGKAGEPDLTSGAVDDFSFGKIRRLTNGTDICILGYGPILGKAAKVADAIRSSGISVTLVSCHTLKPLDVEGIKELLSSHKHVVVLEEHVSSGGLGLRVSEIAFEINAKCKLTKFSLNDAFIHCYGSHDELLAMHGISDSEIRQALVG